MKVTVFLQNAWSPVYAGGTWPRSSWLKALNRSRSGQRIRVLRTAARYHEFWFDNTTPIVGATPNSVVPPAPDHIAAVLAKSCPHMVVTMGKQAAAAVVPLCLSPVLILPHPAYRVVTNELFEEAGRYICSGWDGTVELIQTRDGVRHNWIQKERSQCPTPAI